MRPVEARRPEAGHVDDWLMTYADMITLLLSFFVVFALLAAAHKALPQRIPAPLPAVTAPLRAPLPPPLPRPATPAPRPLPAKTAALPPQPPLTVIPPPELVGSAPMETAPAPAAPPPAKAAPTPLQGDRITTLEMGSAAFFAPGSAALSDGGKAILASLLPRLERALQAGYRVTVEGHTDDTPIKTAEFPSNWELSSARAAAVVHELLEEGVPADRLRAVGYADTRPKAPNRDAAGNPIPANQAKNRRVVIKLEKIEAAKG
jgi:chemotaxis protein MotB